MYDPQHIPETGASGSNVDRELYNDLVQMVPLVQSLIAGKSTFTRRGSMVYTKMPSKESLNRKTIDPKARNTVQSVPVKKRREKTDKELAKKDPDEFSKNLVASSRTSSMYQDSDELIALREQVQDLQYKLLEKDELLKSVENSKTQASSIFGELEELRLKAAEKDSLIKSTQSKLADAKIKLADKQAVVERLQWEAKSSNEKVEKLQDDLSSVQEDISAYMLLFDDLAKNTHTMSSEDYDALPCHLPHSDDGDEVEMQRVEEARLSYIAAVEVAKEKQDEDSIVAAANARLYLNSFISK